MFCKARLNVEHPQLKVKQSAIFSRWRCLQDVRKTFFHKYEILSLKSSLE